MCCLSHSAQLVVARSKSGASPLMAVSRLQRQPQRCFLALSEASADSKSVCEHATAAELGLFYFGVHSLRHCTAAAGCWECQLAVRGAPHELRITWNRVSHPKQHLLACRGLLAAATSLCRLSPGQLCSRHPTHAIACRLRHETASRTLCSRLQTGAQADVCSLCRRDWRLKAGPCGARQRCCSVWPSSCAVWPWRRGRSLAM